MEDYKKSYDLATQKLLKQASVIDSFSLQMFDAQYTLHDITYALRTLYADNKFRNRFVGTQQFQGFTPWAKGFCALSSICIYELYGEASVWEPSAIKLGTWEHAPVVFLRNKFSDEAFDPTGDQFAPLDVPYNLGTPINRSIKDMRTPNKTEFIRLVKKHLDRQS